MGPSFDRWLDTLCEFQTRRAEGKSANPRRELATISEQVDALVLEGLDSRSAADCLARLELIALKYEERRFDEALDELLNCKPTMTLTGPASEVFNANRELLIGNIFLVRDGNAAAAAPYFERAIKASGELTPFVAGNAAVNHGICLSLLGRSKEAISSYEIAGDKYLAAGRTDKVPLILHSLGNAYRALDDVQKGTEYLLQALMKYGEIENDAGAWSTADDLARALLTMGASAPEEFEEWLEKAHSFSQIACAASGSVWNTQKDEPERLADLSDQLTNLATTLCDIASLRDEPVDILATLALMKGRIRSTVLDVSTSSFSKTPEDLSDGLTLGVPEAYLELVIRALEKVADNRPVALIDYIALRENQVLGAYVIVDNDKRYVGPCYGVLHGGKEYDPTTDLRGRLRGDSIVEECDELLNLIARHGQRCAWVVPPTVVGLDDAARRNLESWTTELEKPLKRLGSLFFREEMLEDFREKGVQHVVMCIDSLFARIPFLALQRENGSFIIDEPWSLSCVTAATELVRTAEREDESDGGSDSVYWFGPDSDVNSNRGGDAEFKALESLASVKEHRDSNATLEAAIQALTLGKWCHFRGHGFWSGSISSSGPVFADGAVLTSSEFIRSSGVPGFLFTAACLTGFGQSIGTELAGSFVDYDRGGLRGAVLTIWPIHGEAATVLTASFYQHLKETGDVAKALKNASQECRAELPHPYFWAPFVAVGGWSVTGMIKWHKP